MIELTPGKTYKLPIKNGYLEIIASADPDYPGLDVEYKSDNERNIPDNQLHTQPRVLIECPKNTDMLRCLVWGDAKQEDYTECIEFPHADY